VLTSHLDNGGIRGYGSLLILKDLMRRVGEFEKKLNSTTESSFYPGIYKPRCVDLHIDDGSQHISATPTIGLEESSLFLPCHYFTYIGGTGTGGYSVPLI
jgi:hypothetical protein